MPVVGYLLLLNEDIHHYLTIKYDGRLLQYFPALWRIWFLFYGSFAVALGSLVYAWRCPVAVKKYADGYTLAASETAYHEQLGRTEAMPKLVEDTRAMVASWVRDSINAADLGNMYFTGTSAKVSMCLVEFWNALNAINVWSRIFVYIMFAFGFLLLLTPPAITFVQVTAVLLGLL